MRKFVIFAAVMSVVILLFPGCGSFVHYASTYEDSANSFTDEFPATSIHSTVEHSSTLSVEFISADLCLYSDSKYIYYLAEIKNTSDRPLEMTDIALELENSEGQLVEVVEYVDTYPEVILPGQTAYIHHNVIDAYIDKDIDLSSQYVCKIRYKLEPAVFVDIPVEITQATLTSKWDYPQLVGRVKNDGNVECDYAIVSAPLYSSDGQLLAVFHTYVDIPAGEEIGFDTVLIEADDGLDYSDAVLGEVTVTASSLTY